MEKIPIAEVFASIQGEGKNLGKPSVFVRVWGCNLRCRFKGENCDTPYAVVSEKDTATYMDSETLIGKIHTHLPIKHIVWTGGEPMLYQDFIGPIMKTLYQSEGYTSEMETNGTIFCKQLTTIAIDQFNISPKLYSSNQEQGYEDKRINNDALRSYPAGKTNFKFVITSIDDIAEVMTIHSRYNSIPVYLMPQGMTRDEIIANSPYVVELCIKRGFNYSPREHIMIWDKSRGK